MRNEAGIAEINVTPLIDVMLVLLILFMLVTPASQRALDAAAPLPAASGAPAPPPLVLTIHDAGLSLNQSPVATLADLEARLRETFAMRADRTLFVRASGAVPYRRVMEAMDVARGAGAGRLGVISEEAVKP